MAKPIVGSAQVRVTSSPQQVWEVMKDYGNLDWAVGIAEVKVTGEGVGMVRSVRLEGSEDWLVEYLIAVDEAERKFDYGIDSGMAGVENYRASGQAIADDDGCIIQWQCGGDVESEQEEEMKAVMDAMAEGIAGLFAAQFE